MNAKKHSRMTLGHWRLKIVATIGSGVEFVEIVKRRPIRAANGFSPRFPELIMLCSVEQSAKYASPAVSQTREMCDGRNVLQAYGGGKYRQARGNV